MVAIELQQVTKRFTSEVVAVDAVDLVVEQGQLLTLLGPSGCGKSTTLRLLAGFEQPDTGEIRLNGQVVNGVPPEKRATAMVFQSYALWPHKSVHGNIAFGLRVRRQPADVIRRKVTEVLTLVGLDGLEKRYPRQLSGGQRQRVALARALAIEPAVLLLDEPLSNLDAQLRVRMRDEIRRLQQRLGITMIYVTHDQEEALSISDQVAVMNQGRIEQIAAPEVVYHQPASVFVAGFIGHSSFLSGQVCAVHGDHWVTVRVGEVHLRALCHVPLAVNQHVQLVIKAEDVRLSSGANEEDNQVEGVFLAASYLGSMTRWTLGIGGGTLMLDLPGYHRQSDQPVCTVHLPPEKLIALPDVDTTTTTGPTTHG
jgi:ABC-type Fe3+/spermidine/putrescine transport system ATPase subunit